MWNNLINLSFNSAQFSHSVMSDSLWPHGLQHTRPPCLSPTPRVYPCPLSWWCHPTTSSFVIPFSSRLQSFPASGSFPMSQFFTSGNQCIGVSASASVLPINTWDGFPLGLTGWISLQSKGLSRVFSNTAVQKHQFFGAQLSLWFNSHVHTWLLEKPQLRLYGLLLAKYLCFNTSVLNRDINYIWLLLRLADSESHAFQQDRAGELLYFIHLYNRENPGGPCVMGAKLCQFSMWKAFRREGA